jgi:hypothetical protein
MTQLFRIGQLIKAQRPTRPVRYGVIVSVTKVTPSEYINDHYYYKFLHLSNYYLDEARPNPLYQGEYQKFILEPSEVPKQVSENFEYAKAQGIIPMD